MREAYLTDFSRQTPVDPKFRKKKVNANNLSGR